MESKDTHANFAVCLDLVANADQSGGASSSACECVNLNRVLPAIWQKNKPLN
jgi:hypothetical protein